MYYFDHSWYEISQTIVDYRMKKSAELIEMKGITRQWNINDFDVDADLMVRILFLPFLIIIL